MTRTSDTFVDTSVDLLCRGHRVRFSAPGRSMHPTIREGETITVEPLDPRDVKKGDIILYRSNSGVTAHRVVCIEKADISGEPAQSSKVSNETIDRKNLPLHEVSIKAVRPLLKSYPGRDGPQSRDSGRSSSAALAFLLRGDAAVTCDDPVTPDQILGKVISVERAGRTIILTGRKAKAMHLVHTGASHLRRRIGRMLCGLVLMV